MAWCPVILLLGLVIGSCLWFLVLSREIPPEATVQAVEARYAPQIEWLRVCGRGFSKLDLPDVAPMIAVQRPEMLGDEAIVAAMRLLMQRMKVVVEPSAAVPFAAVLSPAFRALEGIERLGVILSGGNVDLDRLPW